MLRLTSVKFFINDMFFFFRISFGCCGRFTPAEIVSFCLSFLIVCVWVLTGHWLLMDGRSRRELNLETECRLFPPVTIFLYLFPCAGYFFNAFD